MVNASKRGLGLEMVGEVSFQRPDHQQEQEQQRQQRLGGTAKLDAPQSPRWGWRRKKEKKEST
jgi:hypothetical protein